jgi:hypothetical protein
MSFRMSVRVEKVLEEGVYDAVLDNVEDRDTKNGERLMWTLRIPSEDDVQVVGWSSLSPSTRAKAYQWASAIMGEIDPKVGWGPEDVVGGECRVVLDTYVDSQGIEKNGVVRVLKPKTTQGKDENDDVDLPGIEALDA